MMKHLIYYRVKVLLGNRFLLFWTLVFPLVMGLFFKMVFSNLDQIQMLDNSTPVAVVGNDQELRRGLAEVKNENKSVFKVSHLSQSEAQKKLTAGELVGYYDTNSQPIKLVIAQNGVEQNILKDILSRYEQNRAMFTELSKSHPVNLKVPDDHYTFNQAKSRNFSIMSFYFFTLIAMAVGYGVQFGLRNAEDEQADQSENGIRLTLTPIPKMLVVISNLIAALIVFYAIVLIVLAVFHWGYQVDFGNRWGLILLVCLMGSVLQICMGKFIGNLMSKRSYSQKLGVVSLMVSLLTVLAGMMGTQGIKHWIDLNLPLLGKLNAVNLISDSIYQLFFYQSLTTFYQNLVWLLGLTILFVLLDYRFERRVQYVSL
ncbi:ABC transporter permease [Xylocopilactobacillus apicola]|uniref:ABC-2 type transporter transmembrane domain-containing protein n=1 Tax=Xylocopilactobacillus apicola TaxID=2932184 RepID=A0AAU9D2S7_9LACO|nr:ABC transporter permease [Xylocopilactobacillus apicola]BDR58044.1 hypothetical protein XA3_04850 [Xylocopilactobacillus apicola]